MKMEAVGVIGAGVIGVGVAQNLAQSDYQVLLLDVTDDILKDAADQIKRNLRFQSFFGKSAKAPRNGDVLARISFSTDYRILEHADFVIENVIEKWPIKKEVYKAIDAICPPHTVFAANTSAISITRIASATNRAPQVLGIHFMNPVPLKRMVEVIRGY